MGFVVRVSTTLHKPGRQNGRRLLCAFTAGSSQRTATEDACRVSSQASSSRVGIQANVHFYRHIEVTPEHNGNLFFWHFENRHIANRQRTVIWLNGGPGCSSEDGALMEIGPYRVMDESNGPKLAYNDGSWDEFANVLFVDNPVGTGFSFVDTDSFVHELPEMANQFIQFLETWFAVFPEYEHDDVSSVISSKAQN